MSILICGDTHGTMDVGKLHRFFSTRENQYTKNDYLIICGDVAACGFDKDEQNNTREFLRNLPVTVLFCDGNHENFDELNSYAPEEWNGGMVHVIESDIIHLMRGQIYTIDDKKFFVFGGAYSVDRECRVKGLSWFEEELPSDDEYEEGWRNLEINDYTVDYVISHTGPYDVIAEMGYGSFDEAQEQTRVFQQMADRMEFQDWYFGHFHEDADIENYHCLYENIVEL